LVRSSVPESLSSTGCSGRPLGGQLEPGQQELVRRLDGLVGVVERVAFLLARPATDTRLHHHCHPCFIILARIVLARIVAQVRPGIPVGESAQTLQQRRIRLFEAEWRRYDSAAPGTSLILYNRRTDRFEIPPSGGAGYRAPQRTRNRFRARWIENDWRFVGGAEQIRLELSTNAGDANK